MLPEGAEGVLWEVGSDTGRRSEGEGTCALGLEGCQLWTLTNEESVLSGCSESWRQDAEGAADRFLLLEHVRGEGLKRGCQASGG